MAQVEAISKVVRLGTSQTHNGRWYSTFAHIKYQDGNLSICGVEGPTHGGNAIGSCGQIDMNKPKIERLAPGWTKGKLKRFWEVWNRWHLNNMKAECEHQRKRSETWKTHPEAVCPECGYKLGSAWLKETVPLEVLEFLSSLPDTDRQPAWV